MRQKTLSFDGASPRRVKSPDLPFPTSNTANVWPRGIIGLNLTLTLFWSRDALAVFELNTTYGVWFPRPRVRNLFLFLFFYPFDSLHLPPPTSNVQIRIHPTPPPPTAKFGILKHVLGSRVRTWNVQGWVGYFREKRCGRGPLSPSWSVPCRFFRSPLPLMKGAGLEKASVVSWNPPRNGGE